MNPHSLRASAARVVSTPEQMARMVCRAGRAFLAALALLIVAGCATPIPGARPDLLSFLKEGQTKREEILLMLGEPDHVSEDGQQFGYAWSKVKLIVILVATSGGDAGEWGRNYVLHIAFNADQRISESGWIDSESQTWKW